MKREKYNRALILYNIPGSIKKVDRKLKIGVYRNDYIVYKSLQERYTCLYLHQDVHLNLLMSQKMFFLSIQDNIIRKHRFIIRGFEIISKFRLD